MGGPAWIGGGAVGMTTWIQERPGRLIRLTPSRRLHAAQVLGSLAAGPGFLLLLHHLGFWADPRQPLVIKLALASISLLFCLGLYTSLRPATLEFDFAKRELRLYLFPSLKRRLAFGEAAAMTLGSEQHRGDMSARGRVHATTNAVLGLKLKEGGSLALVEDWDRGRLYRLAEELARRLNIPFDPGHFYENSHLERKRPARRRK